MKRSSLLLESSKFQNTNAYKTIQFKTETDFVKYTFGHSPFPGIQLLKLLESPER